MNNLGNENGYYCKSLVNGRELSFLCDTGASVSIIRKNIFNQWSKEEKSKLTPVNTILQTVTGEKTPFLGKIVVEVKIGSQKVNHEMLVGDMIQDGILGIDFMRCHNCDLIVSENMMRINGEKIHCFTKCSDKATCCRVIITENVQIPANSEVIVEGKTIGQMPEKQCCLIEGSENFMQKSGVLVAKVLVEPTQENFLV